MYVPHVPQRTPVLMAQTRTVALVFLSSIATALLMDKVTHKVVMPHHPARPDRPTEYKPTRPLSNHEHGQKGNTDHTPPATPDQDKGGKRNTSQSQPRQSPAGTPMSSKKKKKRKSTDGGGAAVEGEQAQGASPMAKKSKTKKTAER